ncbi:MAG: hypothetical protein E6I30_11415, partial [Chloroflexi bacterium]
MVARRIALVFGAAALALGQSLAVGVGVGAADSGNYTIQASQRVGTAHPSKTWPNVDYGTSSVEIPNHQPNSKTIRHTYAAGTPTVGVTGIASGQVAGFSGFAGLTHKDQRNAGTGSYANTQFTLEPPDQGLCVGNGQVLEGVNNAFQVFNTSGTPLTAPT